MTGSGKHMKGDSTGTGIESDYESDGGDDAFDGDDMFFGGEDLSDDDDYYEEYERKLDFD